jgi:glutaredoxin
MGLTLYELEGCPYCETVADALDDRGIEYETEWWTRCTASATRSGA